MSADFPPDALLRRVPAASPLDALMGEAAGAAADLFGNRSEWKFVLEPEWAVALYGRVAARLRREVFVPGRERTLVHSIYFDSPDFMLYRRASLADASLKLRLRTYATAGADACDPTGFFECKIGKGGKKYKLRAEVPILEAGRLLGPVARAGKPAGSAPRFVKRALACLRAYDMSARLTVSYVREAFVGEGGALRVTFDSGYRAAAIAHGAATAAAAPPGLAPRVVEIKFVAAPPAWLLAVLAELGLPEGGVSFSKFRQGVALAFPDAAARVRAEAALPLPSV